MNSSSVPTNGGQPALGEPVELRAQDAARGLRPRASPSVQDRSAITSAVPGSHGSSRRVEKSGVITMSP